MKRLESSDVIRAYRAEINHHRLGLAIHAVAPVRTTQANVSPALELFATLPEIVRIFRLTGEDCLLLEIRSEHAERVEEVVDSIALFGPVTTSLVLREYPAAGVGGE